MVANLGISAAQGAHCYSTFGMTIPPHGAQHNLRLQKEAEANSSIISSLLWLLDIFFLKMYMNLQ